MSDGTLNLPDGVGKAGEAAAEYYVRQQLGYKVLTQIFRVAEGEIDIIAVDGNEIVFVEVKTRTSKSFGNAIAQISNTKRRRIIAAAMTYLSQENKENHDWRIDVLGVQLSRDGSVDRIDHVKNAVVDE